MNRTGIHWVATTCFIATFLITSICSAATLSTSTARREIEQTLHQRTAAHNRKDVEGYLKTFSTSYVVENVTGIKTDYSRLRSSMTYNFGHGVMGETRYKLTSVAVHGNAARITVLALYTYPPSMQVNAHAHVYKRTISEQIWVKSPSGWQEQHEQYLLDERIFSKKPLTVDTAI